MIIEQYHKGNIFWDVCPEFRALEIFNDFYLKDKTKNKIFSSNVMWAISFCLRKESPMYNLPDKWELAIRDIVKEEKFKWDKYEDLIIAFKASFMSQSERSLLSWEELMAKRDKYLKEQDYYFDQYLVNPETGDNVLSKSGNFITVKGTAEQLDKAFAVTPKMFFDFIKIKQSLEEEEIMKKGKGDKMLSLGDSNQI